MLRSQGIERPRAEWQSMHIYLHSPIGVYTFIAEGYCNKVLAPRLGGAGKVRS